QKAAFVWVVYRSLGFGALVVWKTLGGTRLAPALQIERERKQDAKIWSKSACSSGGRSYCQSRLSGGSAAQGPRLWPTTRATSNYLDGIPQRQPHRRA